MKASAWEFVESPAFQDLNGGGDIDSPSIHAESSDPEASEVIEELLIDQLRDILHAEKQLVKALPAMAKAARSAQLEALFQTHLQETEEQVERLKESLEILDAPGRAKPCKGMAGLVEEGEEVISEGKEKDDVRGRSRIDRRGATRRALRNCGLYNRAQPRPSASPAGDRSTPDHVIGRRAKRRPIARSGRTALDVSGEDAR